MEREEFLRHIFSCNLYELAEAYDECINEAMTTEKIEERLRFIFTGFLKELRGYKYEHNI